jgi:5-methylcytosine-specific restriction endonuclease McrA
LAFSDSTKAQAFLRAGGRCECGRLGCGHLGRCNKVLDPNNRAWGQTWEAHHRTAQAVGGMDVLSNCEILCTACHQKTTTFGGK